MRLDAILAVLLLALPVSAQRLFWKANPEPDLAGYKLHLSGPTNRLVTFQKTVTNYPVLHLPSGEYSATLTAYFSNGVESLTSGPVLFTNDTTAAFILALQVSPAITGPWVEASRITNYVSATQAFYRLEIKR